MILLLYNRMLTLFFAILEDKILSAHWFACAHIVFSFQCCTVLDTERGIILEHFFEGASESWGELFILFNVTF